MLCYWKIIEEIDETEYLTATIDGQQVRILRTEKLKEDRPYYLGFFSEKQFANVSGSNYYDFNQDGKDTAVFPIVAFKNKHKSAEGFFCNWSHLSVCLVQIVKY